MATSRTTKTKRPVREAADFEVPFDPVDALACLYDTDLLLPNADGNYPFTPAPGVDGVLDSIENGWHGRAVLDAIVNAERLVSWTHALQMRLMVELARPGVAGDTSGLAADRLSRLGQPDDEGLLAINEECARELAAAEIGAALTISPITARCRLETAIDLVEQLPSTYRALTEGRIDRTRAALIAERTRILGEPERAKVEAFAAEVAATRTPGKMLPIVDRAVVAADPEAAERRRKEAVRGRRVTSRALPDGIGLISAYLPADKAAAVYELVDSVALATKGIDGRGVDARRADALSDLCELLLSGATVALGDFPQAIDVADADADSDDVGAVGADPMTHTAPGYEDGRARTSSKDGTRVPPAGTKASDSTPTPGDHPSRSAPAARDHSGPPAQTAGATAAPPDDEGRVTDGHAKRPDASDAAFRSESQVFDVIATRADASAEQDDRPSATRPTNSVEPEPVIVPVAHNSAPAEPTTSRPDPDPGSAPANHSSVPVAHPAGCSHHTDPDRPGWTVPHRQGRPVHLVVTMTLASLTGVRDDPAILAGHGEMTAEWGRCIARAARSVSVLVTDDVGRPLDVSARVYRPRQSIRDRVLTMTPTCVFPGCNTAAYRCDLDHQIPFDHADPTRGGPTSADNIDPLCRSHHRLKTHGGWRYWADAHGTRTFRSPLGVRITTPAPDITPVPPRSSPIDEVPPF